VWLCLSPWNAASQPLLGAEEAHGVFFGIHDADRLQVSTTDTPRRLGP